MIMKHIIPLRSLVLVAGLSMLVAGCQNSSVNSVERQIPAGQRSMVNDKRIQTDPALSRKIEVVGVNEAQTEGGLMKVQVEVMNKGRSRYALDYRFEWFDVDGMLVQPISGGLFTVALEGGETSYLNSTAPNPKCVDFVLKLIKSSRR